MRKSLAFVEAFAADGLLGARTRGLPGRLKEELEKLTDDQGAIETIVTRLPEIGSESDRGEKEEAEEGKENGLATKQLIFLADNELPVLAQSLLKLYKEQGPKKWAGLKISEITKALEKTLPRSVDIAMFGRMTTSAAFEDVQAAVQVAHALSTNGLVQEFDYFTAVDDLSGETGAGMIGDTEFNSSTYYKYLNIHWEQLLENLGGDRVVARQAIVALLAAAVTAQPSGKQNSFAAYNLPELVLVEVWKKNLPVSYANAFIKPVRGWGEKSLIDASVEALADYMKRVTKTYNLEGNRAFIALYDYSLPQATEKTSLEDLQQWLGQQLAEA